MAAAALALSSYPWVYQGEMLVGMGDHALTDAHRVKFPREPHAQRQRRGPRVKSVRLFLDTLGPRDACVIGSPDPTCGKFQSGLDREVTDPAAPPVFLPGETRSITLNIKEPTGVSGSLGTTTKTYFVAFDFDPAAEKDRRHGVVITQSDIKPLTGNGIVEAFTPVLSSTQVLIVPTEDVLMLTARNSEGLGPDLDGDGFPTRPSVPSAVKQNDLTAGGQVHLPDGERPGSGRDSSSTADPSTMRGNGAYNDMLALNNKAADVKNIRVWRDWDGNGLFDVAVDSQVTPLDSVQRAFPSTPLKVALSSGTGVPDVTDIELDCVLCMFPAENPFEDPTVAGFEDPVIRLVLNDGQTDELKKEVVLCDDRDVGLNLFKNCKRAQEGTPNHLLD